MKKRFLCVLAGLSFCMSVLAGCGENTEEIIEEEQQVAAPLYVYTWDENLTNDLDYVKGDTSVEVIVLDKNNYQIKLEEIMNNPEAEKVPDIYMVNEAMLESHKGQDEVIKLNEEGIDDACLTEMYTYTLDKAKDDSGNIRALTYKVYPKAFIYRKSLADTYLGVKDTKDMQSFVKNWDTFLDTARHVVKASSSECALISGVDSVAGICSEEEFVKTALTNENLTKGLAANTDADYRAIAGDTVMAYFGDYDFIEEVLEKKCGGTSVGSGTFGDWAVCEGPQVIVGESSYICVNKKCANKELCVNLVKELCTDSAVLDKIAKDGNIVNNKKVMSNQLNAGKGKAAVLGGEDCLGALLSQLERME